MKIKLYFAAIIFASISVGLQAQSSMGISFIGATPTGDIHHKYGYGLGMGFDYESSPEFRISKSLPVSIISSIDFFEVGMFDELENAALPSDLSRRSTVTTSNMNFGFNLGTRLSMTAIKKVTLYADVFGSLRYFNSRAFYVPHGDDEDCPKDAFNQVFSRKLVPQVGLAGGMMYNFNEEFSLNFRVTYSTGGSIKLANPNQISREENDVITYNLDEPSRSNFLTFQLGIVGRLSN
jgi:hypothetical protein